MPSQVWESYDIIWNGNIPYKVELCGLKYKIIDNDANNNHIVKEGTAIEIWIGKSPKHTPKYDGNSILMKIGNCRYMFISNKIYTFFFNDEYYTIDKFVSPIGNSTVPYPYLATTDGWYYLFIEMIAINIGHETNDPYGSYYGHTDDIVTGQLTQKNIRAIDPYEIITHE